MSSNPAERVQAFDPTHLWLVVVAMYAGGDLATTAIGLSVGAIEGNPIPAYIIENYGIVGMGALKLGFLGLCAAMYRILPESHRVAIPLGLLLIGTFAVVWNVGVISVVFVWGWL